MISKLDKSDRIILNLIQNDNSLSLETLAFECGLSVPSVQRRLKKMRKEHVIEKEIAVLNPISLGQEMTFIITVELEKERLDILDAFKRKVRTELQVQQCYYVTGEGDFVLICTARNMSDFEALTHRLFFGDDNVRHFKTSVVMDRTKVGLSISTD